MTCFAHCQLECTIYFQRSFKCPKTQIRARCHAVTEGRVFECLHPDTAGLRLHFRFEKFRNRAVKVTIVVKQNPFFQRQTGAIKPTTIFFPGSTLSSPCVDIHIVWAWWLRANRDCAQICDSKCRQKEYANKTGVCDGVSHMWRSVSLSQRFPTHSNGKQMINIYQSFTGYFVRRLIFISVQDVSQLRSEEMQQICPAIVPRSIRK